MRWIEYLIYFFLFLLPWQTRMILRSGVLNNGNWEYGIVGIYATEILLWFLVLLNIKRLISAKKILLGLLIFVFLSIFFTADRLIAFQQFIHIFEAIAIFIFLTKLPIDRLKAAYAFLAGLALQAILGIYQFLTQSTFVSQWLGLTLHDPAFSGASVLENLDGRWLRAYAGLPHPNIFGGYMAVGILLIAVLLACHLIGKPARILLLVTNCFLLIGLFFSFSRSAWLGLIISLAFFWFFNRRRLIPNGSWQLFFLSGAVPLAILSLLYTPLLTNRISSQGRLETKAIEERVVGYDEARQLFIKYPFFGVGLGNYTLAIHDKIDQSLPAWGYQPAHNVFLLIFAELGIIGVLVILLFFYYQVSERRANSFALPSERRYQRVNTLYFSGWRFNRDLLPIFVLFFLLAIFDHYLWTLYSGLILVGVGVGLLTIMAKDDK
ncbi:MAG: O-antigen ligase family protein [Candidatus Magasanikbacteria bacterium]|nr:O-antigen ligase family protein [Candidatus Magasanikbacteria bacterium]